MPTLKAVLSTNQSTIFACSDRARDPPVHGPAFQVAAHDPIDIEHGQSPSLPRVSVCPHLLRPPVGPIEPNDPKNTEWDHRTSPRGQAARGLGSHRSQDETDGETSRPTSGLMASPSSEES